MVESHDADNNYGNVGATEGIMSPSPDEMERKDFSLPVINTVGGGLGMAANSNSYIPEMTERSHDPIRTGSKCLYSMLIYNRTALVKRFLLTICLYVSLVSPTFLSSNGLHTRNILTGRRHTTGNASEISPTVMAGIKMREQ